ncbi:hypothetical protein GQ42DRAFT_2280 [Ramicandelaber brevisporus]|nr:hypothetical protein GQ42DRAFT_2280 [Ramicandelaber brevisporus]
MLIFHLVCTYFDIIMPGTTEKPFSDGYVLHESLKPSIQPHAGSQSSFPVVLHCVKRQPPHFCVAVEHCFWDVHPDRMNLFHTLLVFFKAISEHSGGYIGQVNMRSNAVGLRPVLQIIDPAY